MPHPEGYNHFGNHPDWPRQKAAAARQGKSLEETITTGIKLFENGVKYIQNAVS